MKTIKLIAILILGTSSMFAQTAYNPFTQNIHFTPEPSVAGFECGSSPHVVFTQGITTAADATQWQTQPLQVTICLTGFSFADADPASVVTGTYASNFNWSFDPFAPNCLVGTQKQTLPGTGSNPLNPNPLASGTIDIALSVPETSPIGTVLAVNVNLQVPGYMTQFNSTPDDNESTQTQTFCALKILGTVYRDDIVDGHVNGTPVDSGITTPILYANLIGANNLVVATTTILSDGTYEFTNVTPNTVYSILLNANPGIVGQPAPTTALPQGWNNVGEDGDGDNQGTDGNPDGSTTVSVSNATIANINFGIDASLPVNMVHFGVTEYNCNALVTWTTASEDNVSHFDVMRKDPGSNRFVKIASLDAVGNSNNEELYSYVDKDVAKSSQAYQYQIRIVDLDASQSFSDVKSVKLTCGGQEASVQIFPNPAHEDINMVYTTNDNDIQLIVDILDVTGRKILSKSQIIYKGTSVINLGVKSLAAGQYLVRYHNVEGNETSLIKFTKK